MKKVFFLILSGALFFASCKKETTTVTETVTVDSSMPVGAFTVMKSGSFVDQNGAGSTGMAQLGKDSQGTQFLKLTGGYTSNFGTGTLAVYLSTSMTYTADPMNGNPDLKLLGISQKAGDTYYKISPDAAAQFNHVILWCATAGVPFGYAPLN